MRQVARRAAFVMVALGAFAGLVGSMAARADDTGSTPWLVRVRVVDVNPQRSNGAGGGIPADSLDVSSRVQPEVDVSYFFTRNIAAELIASYPISHSVDLNHSTIGTFQELPPTLNIQYHFDGLGKYMPYVGAGIVDMQIFNTNILNGAYGLSQSNWGEDLQVGMDYALGGHWVFNVDVKKMFVNVGLTQNGATVLTMHPDPYVMGMGVGYHF